MSRKNKKDQGGQTPKDPSVVSPGQYAVARSWWRKMIGWIFHGALASSTPPDSAEPDAPATLNYVLSNADLMGLREQVNALDRSIQNLGGLFGRVNQLERQFEELRSTFLSNLPPSKDRSEGLPNRNCDDPKPAISPNRPEPSPRTAPARQGQLSIEDLSGALSQALANQTSAGIDIDSLLADFRANVSGAPIQVEYVGQRAAGRWQIAVFLLPSNDGLAVVSPGGLADAEVSTFFEVDYGRRIFACTQPARVKRNGNEITVVRKGRVESS